MNKVFKHTVIIFLALCFFSSANAQNDEPENEMVWVTFDFTKKISKKWRLKYSQLHSYHTQDNHLNFIQPDIGLQYNFIKRWQIAANYLPAFSLDYKAANQLIYHKVRARLRYYSPIGTNFRMYNSLNFEHNFTQRSKFTQRYFLRNDFYYKNNNLPWRLRPFIEQRLYWYQNGRDLQYYDAKGNKLEKTSPNGLHAYRVKAGIKLYPFKKMNFTLFLLKHKEFNTSFFGSKDINSVNTKSGKVRRKFYDFSVLGGFSVTYKL